MEKVSFIRASLPDEEDLIVEVYYDATLWAVLKWREEGILLELVTVTSDPIISLPLDSAIQSLLGAKGRMEE